jgi:hypothetical protein
MRDDILITIRPPQPWLHVLLHVRTRLYESEYRFKTQSNQEHPAIIVTADNVIPEKWDTNKDWRHHGSV